MIGFTEAQVLAWMAPVLWPFLRVLAVFTVAPIFSSNAIPVRARIGLALLVAVAAQPSLPVPMGASWSGPQLWGVVAQQVGLGLCIGFVVRLVFATFELAGDVVGFQMGLNFAAFFDPSINAQSSATARFFGYMASLLFVVLNGHLLVLAAVIQSFNAFPVDQHFLHALSLMQLYRLGGDLFASGLWIALPMVGMLMFANLALGMVSRVAPQMNIYAVGFPITLMVGLIGMAVTLPLLEGPFQLLMARALEVFVGAY
jgi:flagellar biosynthetic protein FliR